MPAQAATEPATKPLILSIDDDEAQLQLRKEILEVNGFSVVNVSTLPCANVITVVTGIMFSWRAPW